jgi:alpha-mannosidase
MNVQCRFFHYSLSKHLLKILTFLYCRSLVLRFLIALICLIIFTQSSKAEDDEWGKLADGDIHIILGSHQDLGWENSIPWCRSAREKYIISPVLRWMNSQWESKYSNGIDAELNSDDWGKHISYSFSNEHTLSLLEYLETKPENLKKISKFTQAGQMEWGATYNCPYESMLSSEALVRELYLGRKMQLKTLGNIGHSRCAWNPDVPARSRQMPQIMAKAGVDYLINSRQKRGYVRWLSPDDKSEILVFSDGHYSQPWLHEGASDNPLKKAGLLFPYAYSFKKTSDLSPPKQTWLYPLHPYYFESVHKQINDYWNTQQNVSWLNWWTHKYPMTIWEKYCKGLSTPYVLPILYTMDMGIPSPYLGAAGCTPEDGGGIYNSDLLTDWANYQKDTPGAPSLRMSTGEYFMDTINTVENREQFDKWTGERPNLWLYIHGPSHHRAVTAMREAGRLIPSAETFATVDALLSGDMSVYPADKLEQAWADAIYPDVGWGGNQGRDTDYRFLQHALAGERAAREILDESLKAIATRVASKDNLGVPIFVFNTLPWTRTDPVVCQVRPNNIYWNIVDEDGNIVRSQIAGKKPTYKTVLKNETTIPDSPLDIVFVAENVPSMGYKTYYLKQSDTPPVEEPIQNGQTDHYRFELTKGGIKSLKDLTYDKAKYPDGREIFNVEKKYNLLNNNNSSFLGGELFLTFSAGNGAGEWVETQQPDPNIFFHKISADAGDWKLIETGDVRYVYEFNAQLDATLKYPQSILVDQYLTKLNLTEDNPNVNVQCSVRQRLIFYRHTKRIDCEVDISDWDGTMYVEWRMALPIAMDKGFVDYEVPMGVNRVGRDEISGVAGAAYSTQDCRMVHPREVQNFISVHNPSDQLGLTLSSSVAVCDYYFPSSPLQSVYVPCGGEEYIVRETLDIYWTPVRHGENTGLYDEVDILLWRNNKTWTLKSNHDNHYYKSSDPKYDANNNNGMAIKVKLPDDLELGDGYRIIIVSSANSNIKFAASNADFTITGKDGQIFKNPTGTSPDTVSNYNGPDTNNEIINPLLQPILLATRGSCHQTGNPFQQEGNHSFKFSILTHQGDWSEGSTYEKNGSTDSIPPGWKYATQTNNPLIGISGVQKSSNTPLEEKLSFCSTNDENIVITAMKKRDDDTLNDSDSNGIDIIFRVYDIKGKDTENAELDFFFSANNTEITSIIEGNPEVESPPEPALMDSGKGLTLDIGHHAIETLAVTTAGYANLTMSVTPEAAGTLLPTKGVYLKPCGQDLNIAAKSAEDYHFLYWSVEGKGTITNQDLPETTIRLSGNATVTANFAKNQESVTLKMAGDPNEGGSSIPGAGAHTVVKKQTIEVVASAADGYHFVKWGIIGAGTIDDPTMPNTTVKLSDNATVTANFAKNWGISTLTMATSLEVSGSLVPMAGPHTVSLGASIPITATPADGFHFLGWSVTGKGRIDNPAVKTTTIVLSGEATAVANFATDNKKVTLTIDSTPNGSGTVNPGVGEYTVFSGQPMEIKALAFEGYHFRNWVLTGSAVVTDPNVWKTTVSLTENATVTANFAASSRQVTLEMLGAPSECGSTIPGTGNYMVNSGEYINISASASEGYHFVNWSVDGCAVIDDPKSTKTQVKLSSYAKLSANFAKNTEELTLTMATLPEDGGSTNPGTGSHKVNSGAPLTIEAYPLSGYHFVNWTTSGFTRLTDPKARKTTVYITADTTITANFAENTEKVNLTMTVSPVAGGSSNPGTGIHEINAGENFTIEAIPADSYHFIQWNIKGSGRILNSKAYKTTAVLNHDATISANFAKNSQPVFLTIASSAPAKGTTNPGTGEHAVNFGESLLISGIPVEGYSFKNWTVHSGEALISDAKSATTTVMVTTDANLIANFRKSIPANLEMLVFPDGKGSINPGIGNYTVNQNESIDIEASPIDGYYFVNWSGDKKGKISDPNSLNSLAILSGNSTITANFAKASCSSELTMESNPKAAGVTTPDIGKHSLKLGENVKIETEATNGYNFINWTVNGNTDIADIYSPSTTAELNGNSIITANFATSDESALLNVLVNAESGGTSIPSGIVTVETNELYGIKAIPFDGYVFVGWTIDSGDAIISYSKRLGTTVMVQDDTQIRAKFVPVCERGRASVYLHISQDCNIGEEEANTDKIKINHAGMCLSEFDPVNDTVRVIIEGNVFNINDEFGEFTVHANEYCYVSDDKTIHLTLDLETKSWSFSAKQVTLQGIDNSNGVDVVLKINNEYFGANYRMLEQSTWNYNNQKNEKTSLELSNGITEFEIEKVSGKIKDTRKKSGTVNVKAANVVLAGGDDFDPEMDTVIIQMDNLSLPIAPGSFKSIKSGVFQYKDSDRGVRMKLNFNNNSWFLKVNKGCDSEKIIPKDGIDVYLIIKNSEAAESLNVKFRTHLKWHP